MVELVKLIGTTDYTQTSVIYKSTVATDYTTGFDSVGYPISYVDATSRGTIATTPWKIESTNTLYTTTADTSTNVDTLYGTGTWHQWSQPSPRERKQAQIKKQLRAAAHLRGNPSFVDSLNPAEVKALQLLKSLVDAENFRKYLKYGFVTVEGMSGLLYNIYRRRNTIVFEDNVQVASLCVHLRGNQPPTDEVIAKVLMCECDEAAIWKQSNHTFRKKTAKIVQLGFDRKAA